MVISYEQVQSMARAAKAHATSKPDTDQPLYRDLGPPAEYPIDALGELIRPAKAIQAITEAPMALCAQSVLAAVTLAVAPLWNVMLPRGIGSRPLTNFYLSKAISGERKSTVDTLALRAVRDMERRLNEEHPSKVYLQANEVDKWLLRRKILKKQHAKNPDDYQAALDQLGARPQEPPVPMILVDNTTPEGLEKHLAIRAWGGIFTGEASAFIGGPAFGEERKLYTASMLNKLHGGEPIIRLRAQAGSHYMPGRRVSMHLMAQPNVVDILLRDRDLNTMGLFSRLLIADPQSTMGKRMQREAPPWALRVLDDYYDCLASILQKIRDPGPNGFEPEAMRLTVDAEEEFHRICDEVELGYLGEDPLSAPSPDFASKLPEHAARLAAVIAAYRDIDHPVIDIGGMTNGCYLAIYYLGELDRLRDNAVIPEQLKLAERVLNYVDKKADGRFYLAEIQRNVRGLATKKQAFEVITELENHSKVYRLPPGTVLDGKPRTDVWDRLDPE